MQWNTKDGLPNSKVLNSISYPYKSCVCSLILAHAQVYIILLMHNCIMGVVTCVAWQVGNQTQMTVMQSSYYSSLEGGMKKKYEDKLKALGVNDPYMYSKTDCVKDYPALWPRVEYPNIYNYLVSTPSRYTREVLKAYKSLEAYKYVVDGWVSNVSLYYPKVTDDGSQFCIVTGDVRHSQKLSAAKPTRGLQ